MASGNTVTPKSPIIISPDTSFFSFGEFISACENIMENTFELPKPINPIPTYSIVSVSHTKRINIPANIMTTLTPKKSRGDIRRRIKAPRKQPAVRKMKYTLVAKPASSSGNASRSMTIFGAVVLVPTSMPTWHIMPRKHRKMNERPSRRIHSPTPDALSGRSSSMGVAASMTTDRKLTMA